MPLYTFKNKQITEVQNTRFDLEGIQERTDLQAALRDKITIISPDTLVIAEEFSEWTEGFRRIDLLGIDKQANLVVIRTLAKVFRGIISVFVIFGDWRSRFY